MTHTCVIYRTYARGAVGSCQCGEWWVAATSRDLAQWLIRPALLERHRQYRMDISLGRFATLAEAVAHSAQAERARREHGPAEAREMWAMRQRNKSPRLKRFARKWFAGQPCTYCGAANPRHLDHVVPRCQGGRDVLQNLTPACYRCNCAKNNRTPEQWREWRLARGLSWPPVWPDAETAAREGSHPEQGKYPTT